MAHDPILWERVAAAMSDENRQNKNAANAGDGPKHIAWLHLINLMGERLQTVVETHAGGGVYRVAADSFCVGVPETSILARHQRQAALPPAPAGSVYYSASADQALCHMPAGCRYIAFDENPKTAERLRALAAYRGRSDSIEIHGNWSGGKGSKSIADVLAGCDPQRTLIMADPFHTDELAAVAEQIPTDFAAVFFAVWPNEADLARCDRDPAFQRVVNRYRQVDAELIRWSWTTRTGFGSSEASFCLAIKSPDNDLTCKRRLEEAIAAESGMLDNLLRAGQLWSFSYTLATVG